MASNTPTVNSSHAIAGRTARCRCISIRIEFYNGIMMNIRAVSLPQNDFLVGLFLQTAVKIKHVIHIFVS